MLEESSKPPSVPFSVGILASLLVVGLLLGTTAYVLVVYLM